MNFRIKDIKQVVLHAQGGSGGTGYIDGVWHGPTEWQCQCGKPYTVTCISSTPLKREWVGLTDEERSYYLQSASNVGWWQAAKMIEAKLKDKNV